MKRSIVLGLVVIAVGGIGLFLASYFGVLNNGQSPFLNSVQVTKSDDLEGNSKAEVSWKVEEVVRNLEVPWSMVFTSPSRLLIAERPGRLRVVENGQLLSTPLHVFSEVSSTSEEGLMGLTLDPDYQTNKFLYVSYAYPVGEELVVKIVRFTDENTRLSQEKLILDKIPAARNHAGNRLRFGPDGKLYSTTGDATERRLAQDLSSLAGKILRMNPDGSVPTDNPFPDSLVFSYGHRNPQGLDWQPITNNLVAAEHGPSLFDGPAGGDEVNLIKSGQNYGWPIISHEKTRDGLQTPLQLYTPAEAPASGMFYRSGALLPQFQNNYFFGALKGEGLIRLIFDPQNPDRIQSQEKLFFQEYGRIREVTEGPDGAIYFSTSNRDGRGKMQAGDDKIFRIVRE